MHSIRAYIFPISDGEDFGENTSQYIEEIQDSSIKLFTLGIGTKEGSNIISAKGKTKKDKYGEEVITKLSESDEINEFIKRFGN